MEVQRLNMGAVSIKGGANGDGQEVVANQEEENHVGGAKENGQEILANHIEENMKGGAKGGEQNKQTESKITEAKAATVVNGYAGKEELEKDVDLDIVECL